LRFTAAQAAQKNNRADLYIEPLFTAAQAAQKKYATRCVFATHHPSGFFYVCCQFRHCHEILNQPT